MRLLWFLFGAACGFAARALLTAEAIEAAAATEAPEAREVPEADTEPWASERGAPPPATGDDTERRCAGRTRDGRPCSRAAEPGSAYCWQHGGAG